MVLVVDDREQDLLVSGGLEGVRDYEDRFSTDLPLVGIAHCYYYLIEKLLVVQERNYVLLGAGGDVRDCPECLLDLSLSNLVTEQGVESIQSSMEEDKI